MWIYFLISVTMLMVGLLVHRGKAYFLISGYNTYSQEKKEKVDVRSIARLMGYYGYTNAAVFFLVGILDYMGIEAGLIPSLLYFGLSTLYLLVKAQKYDGNMYGEDGEMTKKSRIQVWLIIGIMSFIMLFVGYMLYSSSRDTIAVITDQELVIEGMYGNSFSLSSIENLNLIDEIPDIIRRTNGSAIGSNLRGHFRMKELGSVLIFMNADVSPYIYFEYDAGKVIFNLGEEATTIRFFEEILQRVD